MNLFDELDKDNKTTKGVFSNEREMKQYEKDDVEMRMRAIEKKDRQFALVGTAAQEFKAELRARKANDTVIKGKTPTATGDGIAIEGGTPTNGMWQ